MGWGRGGLCRGVMCGGTHRSCACSSGFPLSTSVCRCTRRRICGGKLSRRFSLRSRYSRSVRLMKSWLGMVSMLRAGRSEAGRRRQCKVHSSRPSAPNGPQSSSPHPPLPLTGTCCG